MVKFKGNRRVTVCVVGSTVNDQGGNEPVDIDSWEKWADVEDRSGGNSFPYQQQVWQYDYRVKMRREASRPTQSNYEIEYDGVRMKIESLSIETEAFQQFEICRCSKIDGAVRIVPVGDFIVTESGLGLLTESGNNLVLNISNTLVTESGNILQTESGNNLILQ